MPVRVKCRCGQELVLRYGEGVYLLLGVVVLGLLVNTLAVILLYLRVEEGPRGARAPERASERAGAPVQSASSPPEDQVPAAAEGPATGDRPAAGEGLPRERAASRRPALPVLSPGPSSSPSPGPPPPRPPAPAAAPAPARAAGAAEPQAAPPALALVPERSAAGEDSLEEALLPTARGGGGRGSAASDPGAAQSGAAQSGAAQSGAAVSAEAELPREGARALLEEEPLLRLAALEGAAASSPRLLYAFLHDPDAHLRRRALGLALVRASASSPPPAGEEDRESLALLLRGASPLLEVDGLGASLAELERRVLPGAKPGESGADHEAALRPLREAKDGGWQSLELAARAQLASPGLDLLRGRLRALRDKGTDLAFLVDVSQSMDEAFPRIQESMAWVLPALAWALPGARIGLLLYRDEVVAAGDLSATPAKDLLPLLRGTRAEGGGDVPEAVHVAVKTALSLGHLHWRSEAEKHLLVVGDAPPPFADGRRLLALAGLAFRQGAYRIHTLSVETQETGAGVSVPFFSELAERTGGSAASPERGKEGEAVLRCLLAGRGDKEEEEIVAKLSVSLREIFSPDA